jgi:predicted lysophospholipase L1 biosynthesis ABC-type transport system permease subunit
LAIRMALGAGRRSVVGLVLRDGLWMATTGVIAGAAIALAMERVAGGLLFRISPKISRRTPRSPLF